jgi:hypothetical protein
MANIKISELTALTPPAAADELVVVDVSATSTKKTTVGEVVGIITGDVEVASNGTATISELPVSKLQDGAARQLLQTDAAGAGVEWASNIDIPGTLDVTGAAVFDSSVSVTGTITGSLTGAASLNILKVGDVMTGALGIIAGSQTSPSLYVSGDANTGVYSPGTDQIAISTNGLERVRLDSSGKLLVGTTISRQNWFNGSGLAPQVQIEGAGLVARLSLVRNDNSSNSHGILLGKTRGSAYEIVNADDPIGYFSFQGADGTELVEAARIESYIDGGPGANDMPGRIVFSTTADGASSPTERLRITSAGVLQVADAGNITVGTTTGTKIGTATTQKIGFYNKTPVVQPTAVADATDAASVITQLNALLARMRDLGLIAT